MEKEKTGITPAGILALASGDIGNFISASIPGEIEAQEAAGQADMINKTVLPKMIDRDVDDSKCKYEKLGIKVIDSDDEIFYNVKLPDGWKVKSGGSSYWSYLYDEKDRERASIFYKAAFYDKRAHLNITSRFRIATKREFEIDWSKARNIPKEELDELNEKEKKSLIFGVVLDCNKIIFETIHKKQKKEDYFKQTDNLYKICRKYLDKHYPDWEDLFAYWK